MPIRKEKPQGEQSTPPPKPPQVEWKDVQAGIDTAIKEGRHSEKGVRYCTRCGQQVDAIWYIQGQIRLCKKCSGE